MCTTGVIGKITAYGAARVNFNDDDIIVDYDSSTYCNIDLGVRILLDSRKSALESNSAQFLGTSTKMRSMMSVINRKKSPVTARSRSIECSLSMSAMWVQSIWAVL